MRVQQTPERQFWMRRIDKGRLPKVTDSCLYAISTDDGISLAHDTSEWPPHVQSHAARRNGYHPLFNDLRHFGRPSTSLWQNILRAQKESKRSQMEMACRSQMELACQNQAGKEKLHPLSQRRSRACPPPPVPPPPWCPTPPLPSWLLPPPEPGSRASTWRGRGPGTSAN